MRIGVDLDNTIVCYDDVFHTAARQRGLLSEPIPKGKTALRDYLRNIGREADWTALQGYVYGEAMARADPFPGALETLASWVRAGHAVCIVSHRTRFPFAGPPFDLHEAAFDWLRRRQVIESDGHSLPRDRVFLEETRQAKMARITELGCACFIDDLPEFLSDAAFPEGVQRIAFDPHHEAEPSSLYRRAHSWTEIARLVAELAETSSESGG